MPLVVIVFVPDVAANVVTPVPAVNVILVELAVIMKSPYIILAPFVRVPVKPSKIRL